MAAKKMILEKRMTKNKRYSAVRVSLTKNNDLKSLLPSSCLAEMKKRPQNIVRLIEVRERNSIKFRDFLTNGLIL